MGELVGSGFKVNILEQLLLHPLAFVMVTLYEPAVPIVISCVDAVKLPGPVHSYEDIPVAALHIVVLPAQTASVPLVIAHVGGEFTVTLRLLAALVPQELPAVTVMEPS